MGPEVSPNPLQPQRQTVDQIHFENEGQSHSSIERSVLSGWRCTRDVAYGSGVGFEPPVVAEIARFSTWKNAHTVIRTIRGNFAGYLWFLKGDITEFLDPYWLSTFFDFAHEEAPKVASYGHCGILSPLLANVCLNELDQMMEEKTLEFLRPNKLDSIWKDSVNDGCFNPAWPEFVPSRGKEKTRKMDYIRYGGNFLIGIRGPREDVVQIRKEIIEFCERRFGMRLDDTNVKIKHISKGIQFLDYIICRGVIHPTLGYIAQMNKFLETMADWYSYADNRKKIVGFCAYVIRSSLAKLYTTRYRLKSSAKSTR